MNRRVLLSWLVCLPAACFAAEPAAPPAGAGAAKAAEPLQATLVADVAAVAPGGTFTLGIRMAMAPHWHTYWIHPGDSGAAPRFNLRGPAGCSFGPVQFPLPRRLALDGYVCFGYEDEVMLLVAATVPAGAKPGDTVKFEVDAAWMACKEECVEGGAKLAVSLPVKDKAEPADAALFAAWRDRLPRSIEGAALASVEQPDPAGASPRVVLAWREPPKEVEWFPAPGAALGIDKVVVRHQGKRTEIAFEHTVYKPAQATGEFNSLVVCTDAAGRRQGFFLPVRLPKK